MRMRVGTRLGAALAVTLAPLAAGPVSHTVTHTAAHSDSGSQSEVLVSSDATTGPSTPVDPSVPPLPGAGAAKVTRFAVDPVQRIEPQTVLEGRLLSGDKHRKIRVEGPRGGHVWTASALAEHDLPAAAMKAYKNAAADVASSDPGCRIPWTLLAGIGRVESDHGRYGGSVLGSDGVPRPAIIGVPLNGKGPVAAIHDTDNGVFDGDKVWDRAVGPMQFIPSTWAYAGRDGDGDGVKNPNDINDAALAAADYLCAGGGNLGTDAGQTAAIFRYNPSDYYVELVMAFEHGYQTGVFAIPSPPAPQTTDTAAAKARKHAEKAARQAAKKAAKKAAAEKAARQAKKAAKHAAATSTKAPTATKTPAKSTTKSGTSSPSPTKTPTPSKTPTPTKTPTPAPTSTSPSPEFVQASGILAGSGNAWTLDGKPLDLGDVDLTATAPYDYDNDGTAESIQDELAGLASTKVTLMVKSGTLSVYGIGNEPFRNADGTLAHPAS